LNYRIEKIGDFKLNIIDMPTLGLGLELLCLTPLSTLFQLYIMAVSFIGGGNQSTWKKPLTCCKSLTNLSHNVNSIVLTRDRHGRGRMVVGFTTTCVISAYHH
jgi:hypothetical protein